MLSRIIGGFGITEDIEKTETIDLTKVENPQTQNKKKSFNTFRGKTIRSTGNQKYSTKEIFISLNLIM